jgi:trans-aconitate methyltransferase
VARGYVGGQATLGSRLLAEDLSDAMVLDAAALALIAARNELGFTGNTVAADVRGSRPNRQYRLCYDRAVLHFLTAPEDRVAYRQTLDAAVEPGGWVAVGTRREERHTPWDSVPAFTWLLLRRVSRETSAGAA